MIIPIFRGGTAPADDHLFPKIPLPCTIADSLLLEGEVELRYMLGCPVRSYMLELGCGRTGDHIWSPYCYGAVDVVLLVAELD